MVQHINEEQDILESFEKDEWRSTKPSKKQLGVYAKYARKVMTKDKRINIRLPSATLEALKLRALEEGLPYQTLIASVLHKFVTGRFS
jgi:predicted DNA binding CopG/RHH family protein